MVNKAEHIVTLSENYAREQPIRIALFEGGQHSLVEHSAEVDQTARAFLDKYMRDKEQWPNMEPNGN